MKRSAVAVIGAVLLAACGTPSPDLFVVTRSGSDAKANLRLLVSDGGTVRCNDAAAKPLDADHLLAARELARDLEKQAALGLVLEARKDSTLRYGVRLSPGTIEFSDTSTGRTPEMNRIVAFTADVSETVCGLER